MVKGVLLYYRPPPRLAQEEREKEKRKMLGWLARKKYQFEAITSFTMLEPSEKRVLCILHTSYQEIIILL